MKLLLGTVTSFALIIHLVYEFSGGIPWFRYNETDITGVDLYR